MFVAGQIKAVNSCVNVSGLCVENLKKKKKHHITDSRSSFKRALYRRFPATQRNRTVLQTSLYYLLFKIRLNNTLLNNNSFPCSEGRF